MERGLHIVNIKWRKWRTLRRSVIVAWFVSYMVVLLLPILLSTWVYHETVKALQQQIERAHDSLLQQMQETVDNRIDSFQRLTTQIYGDVNVQSLLYSNTFARGDYRYEVYQVAQDLKLFRSTYTTLDDFYIYWTPSDSVIRPSTSQPGEMAYQELYGGGDLSLAQWRELVSATGKQRFLRTTAHYESGLSKEYLTFVRPFPVDLNNQPTGSAVVMIDQQQILKALAGIRDFSDGETLIVAGDGTILVSDQKKQQTLPEFNQFEGEKGYIENNQSGELARYYFIRSNNSDLTYVSIVPDRLVRKEANEVRRLMYYGVGVSLLGGLVLTYLFMRRNYQPIRRMIDILNMRLNKQTGMDSNEFAWIEDHLSRTLSENDRISLRMQQQQNQLRSGFIARLFKGKVDEQDDISREEILESLHIGSEADQFAVLLIYIESSPVFHERTADMDNHRQDRLLHFIITNVIEETIAVAYRIHLSEVDELTACLVQLPVEQQSLSRLIELVQSAQVFLKHKYGAEMTIAISGVHTGIDGIAIAYHEATISLEYKFVADHAEVLIYEQLYQERLLQQSHDYYFPLSIERQLLNDMKVGDAERARQLLEEIVERNLHETVLPIELAKCLMFDLVGTFIKSMVESGDSKDVFLTRHQQTIETLTRAGTVKEMKGLLLFMLEDVCRHTAARQEHNKQKNRNLELEHLIQQVQQFVDHNYTNPDLNVSMIGEHFEMKATYLSKLFRDHIGEGLLDYINRMRIDQAKALLRDQPITLEEIAGQSGFQSLNTFIRIFKKIEGMTPGQYRNTL